ncbi:BglG family transcription antiterminator LicT [Paraliobacillus sediminis]|uniref:BglG family transcription antiterminator LicT n=1 Tax=Paraliobacillus sediminis TaxID=1885916 RepID=UPI0013C2B42A|nr:PRD domain-containing protein [Paraliobacillus sediminis]
MKLKQAFNNNVALVLDQNGNEIIVMGKGVGFKKQKFEEIDQSLIDKTYSLNKPESSQLSNIFNDIPADYIYLTNKIIEIGEKVLQKEFNDVFLVTLADHLNFAFEKEKQNIVIQNPLHWEVKNIYHNEYQIGREALELIKEQTSIVLPDNEATAIALHFVNAQYQQEEMKETFQITEIMNKVLEIISYHFQIKLEENSINFSRLMTHLRYFIIRQLNSEKNQNEEIASLYDHIKERYTNAYNCVKKIERYLSVEYKWVCSNEELAYLTIHIHRMTTRKE